MNDELMKANDSQLTAEELEKKDVSEEVKASAG